jgi:3-deoxy-D-manno-octulosonic-acid transferase
LAPELLTAPRPFTLVAGSTWPPDEEIVLGAWTALGPQAADWRLVLVPHEPTPAHLEPIFAALERAGIAAKRYSELAASGLGDARCIVVDRVGILAELYAAGDAAHVGGAFGTGVHNLLEPASMGLPVSFGPRHDNAPEAGLLLDSGAGSVVHSATDLADGLRLLGTDPSTRRRRGDAARATVEAHLGAAARCWARLQPFLGSAPGARHLENDR